MTAKNLVLFMFLAISATIYSSGVRGEEYAYHAQVKGMVCAFCAYNVTKKISSLKGVKSESVQVNLRAGTVDFSTNKAIKLSRAQAVFSTSGYKLISLQRVKSKRSRAPEFTVQPTVVFKFAPAHLKVVSPLLDALGSLAQAGPHRFNIRAPARLETSILEPLLAGRKHVVSVKFVTTDKPMIEIAVYATVTKNKR